MRGYVKKIKQRASKLTNEQLISFINDVAEENEGLYSILDSIPTGILIVDKDFYYLLSNNILESFLPLKCHFDESKSQKVPVWELIDDKEIAEFCKNCQIQKVTNHSGDFTVTTSGGSVRFLNINLMPLNQDGKLEGRIFLIRDTTDSKKQEILLHRMENLANLTNLAAGMAHEIKNPLGAISIHIQLIQKALLKARNNNDILPPKKFVEDHIDIVNEEIEHLNSLVMDFLFAVRPINANLELKDPAELIKNIVSFFEPEFNKSNIRIDLEISEKTERIMMDERLLREVIVNLAQNALAAIKSRFPECSESSESPSNEMPGLFSLKLFISDNKYIIKVSDNGCGMDSDTVAKVFEPYFTTKANGTGLGMTMVYKIVKEFSGEITVNSKPGEGTEFTLIFPLHQQNKKLLEQNK